MPRFPFLLIAQQQGGAGRCEALPHCNVRVSTANVRVEPSPLPEQPDHRRSATDI